jgi:hypothetical protein
MVPNLVLCGSIALGHYIGDAVGALESLPPTGRLITKNPQATSVCILLGLFLLQRIAINRPKFAVNGFSIIVSDTRLS